MTTTQITRTEYADNGLDIVRWVLTVDGEQVAFLDAHTSGLILNVETVAGQERQGFASSLYAQADAELGLLHVPAWGRSFEGEMFAEAMGGATMDDEQAASILGVDLAVVTGAVFDEE